ncbi:uncharacterized protein [Rutidosis leptorrhynchoides]
MDGELAAGPSHLHGRCCLCYEILPSAIETIRDVEAINVCRECKLLFLEDDSTQYQLRPWTHVLSDTETDGYIGHGDSFSYDPFDSDSDGSVLSNHVSSHPNARSYVDSETDNDEFDEVEGDVSAVESLVGRIQLRRSLATNGRNLPIDWLNEILSNESMINSEISQLFSPFEDQETSGAPAGTSFVKNIERVVVNEEFVCVICKDDVCVGGVMNRLPCSHVYHPSCIVRWLNARNTCPLCRYELPTDKDCEKECASFEGNSNDVSGDGKWWFVAAPVVSVVAIGVVVWFVGGGLTGQRENISRRWGAFL